MKNEPAGKRPAGGWLGPRPVPEGLGQGRRISGSRPAVEVYGWQVREKPLSIKIPIDIVKRLQDDILYGLGMRTPCDVMGLLIGRVAKEYSSTITIHDYVLAGYTSDAAGSRLWSDERLADMVKPWSKATSANYVVGFFRSQSEEWPEIAKEDLKRAKRLLRRTPNVFLLIRSGLSRSYAGRLFLRPSGRARLDEEYGEFPLNADILRTQWDATGSKREGSGLHFIPGNPLAGKQRPEPPRHIQEIVDAVFEPVEPWNDDVIVTPLHLDESQIVEMLPHESVEAAEAPKRGLWAKLFRRASEQAPHLEPAAVSITVGLPAAEPPEALQSPVAAKLPATEETTSVQPVAAASAVEIPEVAPEPAQQTLWAKLFGAEAEQAPHIEPVAAASAVEIPEVATEPAQQTLWAKLFGTTTDQAPHIEPVAAASAVEIPEVAPEPAQQTLWAKLFGTTTEQALHIEPVAAASAVEIPEVAPEPAHQTLWAKLFGTTTDQAPHIEPVAAASAVDTPEVATEPAQQTLWAKLFRPAMEEAPHVEPVAAASAVDNPEVATEPAQQSLFAKLFRPTAEEAPSVEPVAVEIPDVATEPAQQSLWAKLFRPAMEEAPHIEPVAAANRVEIPDAPLDLAQPSLWARLFGTTREEPPHIEPIAANDTENIAWAEAAEAPSTEEAWEQPAEAYQFDVDAEPEQSLWAKFFRLMTGHAAPVEPASATDRPDFGSESIAEEPLQAPAFADNPPPPPSRYSWVGIAATWTIAVGVTMWCMSGRGPFSQRRPEAVETETRPAVIANPIGLQVDSAGGLLEIAWDPISVSAMTSSGGFLTIRDGSVLKEVRLDSGEIRSGHLYYGPRNTDLGIRLEVARNDGEVASESIRVVGPPPRGRVSVK